MESKSSPRRYTEVLRTDIVVDLNNPTSKRISEVISERGPIPYSKYMQECLFGTDGYYSEGKVKLGGKAETNDFTTSAETSDIFGGLIGAALYSVWQTMGTPSRFDIVEIGGGAGGTAEGVLHWTKNLYPDFYDALHYTIVDLSDNLIAQQQARLAKFPRKVTTQKKSVYDCNFSHLEGAIISNEIPDTAPVDIVRRHNGVLQQKYVDIENGCWVEKWGIPQHQTLAFMQKYGMTVPEGIEEPINMFVEDFQRITGTLKKGIVLTFDYGGATNVGQADHPAIRFYGHGVTKENIENPQIGYLSPGSIDITADVNFRPYIYGAALQSLFIIYGRQREIFGEFAVRNAMKTMIDEKYFQIQSQKDLRELHKALNKINKFGRTFFAVLTTTPDVVLPSVHNGSKSVWGMLPQQKVTLSNIKPNTTYKFYEVVNNKRVSPYEEVSDSEGKMEISPHIYFGNGCIVEETDSGERVVADFSDKKLADEIANQVVTSIKNLQASS